MPKQPENKRTSFGYFDHLVSCQMEAVMGCFDNAAVLLTLQSRG